jgi:PAB-dependent poly(A)-specific ribonuclease subunit 2
MALSPSGEYLAFGDADGGLHLWCDKEVGEGREGELGRFNGYEGIKPEWVDESEALPNIAWDEKT